MDKELVTAAEYLTAKLSKIEADLAEIKKRLAEPPPLPISEVLLSRNEAARHLGICMPFLLKLVNEGCIPAHRIPMSNKKRFKRSELEKCLVPVRGIKLRFTDNKTNH